MLWCMRTTLTIDEDVAVQLNRLRETRHAGLKEIANEAMRAGLRQMSRPARPTVIYQTQPVSLGRCLIGNIDDISEVLAVAEGESFR